MCIRDRFSGYFATQFYKTSVQTKSEARQEFLNQLKHNNEIIVDQNIYEALFNERKMIKNWSKSNPEAVSYTHLDVYKRQVLSFGMSSSIRIQLRWVKSSIILVLKLKELEMNARKNTW